MEQLEQVKDVVTTWCGRTKETMSDYLEKPTVRTRHQVLITGLLLFFTGVIVGFLVSPIKKGISICSNNVDSFSSNEAYDNGQASNTMTKENKRKKRRK